MSVNVEQARSRSATVPIDDYPGGRPTGVVQLDGEGHSGFGELVAFTEPEHRELARRLPQLVPAQRGRWEDLVPAEAGPYERAAIEAALIDLGLRQAGLGLAQLWGAQESLLRWVVSLSAAADPRAFIERRLADLARENDPTDDRTRARPVELKLDVHEGWTGETIAWLRDQQRVVTLDFKEAGSLALAERLSAAFPEALFEDPPPGCQHRRIARDRPWPRWKDVAAAIGRREWVNLKAPRMGRVPGGVAGAGCGGGGAGVPGGHVRGGTGAGAGATAGGDVFAPMAPMIWRRFPAGARPCRAPRRPRSASTAPASARTWTGRRSGRLSPPTVRWIESRRLPGTLDPHPPAGAVARGRRG
jgi:hypothetical protein